MPFSDFLHSLRKRHGLTQEEFRKTIGISRTYVSTLESRGTKSKKEPSIQLLGKISREFKLDARERMEMIDSIVGEDNAQHAARYQKEDVLPFLQAILISGLKQLTLAELELLVKIQATLDTIMPLRAIKTLIEELRSTQRPA